MDKEILYTYEEITGTHPEAEEGTIIKFDELPEYLFVWPHGTREILLYVTNNIVSLKESFFKYVVSIEAKKDTNKQEVDNVTAEVAMWILQQKENKTLDEAFLFGIER
jgi:hypothetical protein